MVTSIGSVLPGVSPQATGPAHDEKTQRSIAEARRLIAQNHISGAKAMRLSTMLSQAEQNISSGKVVDAQRMAREALKIAQKESDSTGNADAAENGNVPGAVQSGDDDDTENTSATTDEANPNDPSQHETTSYQDGSSDNGVSFQYAAPLTQAQAPFAVQQHELSHVRRETSDAILNGQHVMASVTIKSHIDPRTGERQIEGGRTRIFIFPEIKVEPLLGNNLNVKA